VTVTCAWCGRYLGTKDGHGVEGKSHGICEDCARRWLSDERVEVAVAECETVMGNDALDEMVK
jgi:hypothetical protein